MAFIEIASKSTTAFSTTQNPSINIPSGTEDGDLLVAILMGWRDGGGPTVTVSTPVGWTSMINTEFTNDTDSIRTVVFWKIADSEGASQTFTTGGLSGGQYGGVMFRCINPAASPADQSNSDEDATDVGNIQIPITPSVINTLMFFIPGVFAGDLVSFSFTDDPDWTEEFDADTGTYQFQIHSAFRAEDTSTGNGSFTGSGDNGGVFTIVNFKSFPDVTVNPDPITATLSVQAPTVAGGANVSVSVIEATLSVQAPTVTVGNAKWANADKSSTTWTNEEKS